MRSWTRTATLAKPDERCRHADEPDHDELCEREQRFLLKAIDEDIDLTDHMDDAVKSLRIVLAADESVREGGVRAAVARLRSCISDMLFCWYGVGGLAPDA